MNDNSANKNINPSNIEINILPTKESANPPIIQKNDKTKLSFGKKVQEEIKIWARSTTTHGVQKLSNARQIFGQIFWILFILLALALCFTVVAKNITDYLQFEVTTKIRIIDKTEIEFPAISLCNLNPFITPSANAYIKNYMLIKYLNRKFT